MNVSISTVFKTANCGSFLQAYALKAKIEECGHNVTFCNYPIPFMNTSFYKTLQSIFQWIKGKRARSAHILAVKANFEAAQKTFKVVNSLAETDILICGSDTIWNINDPFFLKNWRVFWGDSFKGKKATYAASIGETSSEELEVHSKLCQALQSFDYISVRDDATRCFVERNYNGNSEIVDVVDPTMLLSAEEYGKIAPECEDKNFILFYFFGNVPENIKFQVKEYAKMNNKRIIVFGENTGWADKYISNDPYLMLSYFRAADFIVTNTFHGNVFSILFNKQFFSLGKEKQKVVNLHEKLGVEGRLVDAGDDCSSLFANMICYDNVNKNIDALRKASIEYLNKVLS